MAGASEGSTASRVWPAPCSITEKYRPVVEDVVDLGDTGSLVVLLGEAVEVDLGLGLDENVLAVAVLDKIKRIRPADGRRNGWCRQPWTGFRST